MNIPKVVRMLSFPLVLAALQSNAQPAYYPLATGNTWQFGDPQHQTRALGDTLLPDGYRYSVLLDTWYNVREYQRQQGDSVFLPGLLLYDFSRLPGDTIATAAGGYVCVFQSTSVAMVLGRQLRQWVFGRSWGPFTGELHRVTDSLGVTSITNLEPPPPSQKILTGARIDGVSWGVITSLRTGIDPAISKRITLEQNYPNPFNPQTKIRFALPQQSHVKLTIHNMLGQQVRALLDESKEPGDYELSFDGSNLGSGVYFYRLEAGGIVETRRMTLLK